MTLREAVGALEGKAALGDEDALALRRAIYGDTLTVTREEVETLFALNASAAHVSTAWPQLFVEAATDLVARQGTPAGYVDEASADWLVALVRTHSIKGDEVELLLHVLEQADGAPARFDAFVLEVVTRYALFTLQRLGRLDVQVVELLRGAVSAKGSADNVAVTRPENAASARPKLKAGLQALQRRAA